MERGTRDPYDVLGVDPGASDEEVKAAFRRKAEIYHPDRYRDRPADVQDEAARMMQELNEARDKIVRQRSSSTGETPSSASPGDSPSRPPPQPSPAPSESQPHRQPVAKSESDDRSGLGQVMWMVLLVLSLGAFVVVAVVSTVGSSEGQDSSTSAATGAAPSSRPSPVTERTTTSTTTTTTATPPSTSATLATSVASESIDGRSLPAAVAETATAVHVAALDGDYDTLRSLMPPEFTFTFGVDTDPIAYWQGLEAEGLDPLGDLAAALELPPTLDAYGDGENIAAFPYLFAKPPAAYGAQDTPAIEHLGYDQTDVQDWTNYGSYIGWRAMFGSDGTWYAFVEGD